MRASIIRIGNSQGIRIPKILLQQSHLGSEVELDVENEKIIIRPATHPRQGWGEKFRLMAEGGDDRLLDGYMTVPTEWDKEEWQW